MRRIRCLTVLLVALVAGPAAASVEGVWRCASVRGIPIALVTIKGNTYSFVAAELDWAPKEDTANGKGGLTHDGDLIRIEDGPLWERNGMTGQIRGTALEWTDEIGLLLTCSPG